MEPESPRWPERLSRLFRGPPAPRPGAEIELTWIALPPYEVAPGLVVSGLLLENQGSRTVVGVRAALHFLPRHPILDMAVTSEEKVRIHGQPGASSAAITLAQLRPGARAVFYVTTAQEEMPDIRVTVRGFGRR